MASATLTGKRILVAPLDWGLGHATRCIPIIRAVEERGGRVIIGADRAPLALLQAEFPHLDHVILPGMEVRYSAGADQSLKLLRQFPTMLGSVRREHALWSELQKGLGVHAIISDQRFGIRSPQIPSVLITHQLFPHVAFGGALIRRINQKLVGRFDRCWVMDMPEAPGLAGDLSHGGPLPENARFIGLQSRFTDVSIAKAEVVYDIVAVISGPEPQRSILEKLLLAQLEDRPGHHLLVQGLPMASGSVRKGNVTCVAHLPGRELASAMQAARMIVSRSGYTTLMDLVALGRTALLIPTPGQPEQELLGHLHRRTELFHVQHQDSLDLSSAWEQLSGRRTSIPPMTSSLLASALDELSEML